MIGSFDPFDICGFGVQIEEIIAKAFEVAGQVGAKTGDIFFCNLDACVLKFVDSFSQIKNVGSIPTKVHEVSQGFFTFKGVFAQIP